MIGAGHTLSDVRCYTLPQIEAFNTAVASQVRASARMAAIAARSAGIKKDDWKKLMKELD